MTARSSGRTTGCSPAASSVSCATPAARRSRFGITGSISLCRPRAERWSARARGRRLASSRSRCAPLSARYLGSAGGDPAAGYAVVRRLRVLPVARPDRRRAAAAEAAELARPARLGAHLAARANATRARARVVPRCAARPRPCGAERRALPPLLPGAECRRRDDDGGVRTSCTRKADARAWAECVRAPTFAAWTACASTLHNHWHKAIAARSRRARRRAVRPGVSRVGAAAAGADAIPRKARRVPPRLRSRRLPERAHLRERPELLLRARGDRLQLRRMDGGVDRAASAPPRHGDRPNAVARGLHRRARGARRACRPPPARQGATADSSFTPFNRSWWDAHDFARALVDEVAFERAFGGANGAGSPDEPACAPSAVAAQLRLEAGTRRGRLK